MYFSLLNIDWKSSVEAMHAKDVKRVTSSENLKSLYISLKIFFVSAVRISQYWYFGC